MNIDDVVIVAPTKRPPPVNSLLVYSPGPIEVIIVADPNVYKEHKAYYRKVHTVVKGAPGLAAQIARCYEWAHHFDYRWWFRVDDDLAPKTFIHRNGRYPSLPDVVRYARACVKRTNTTLAGFMNGSNRFWFGKGFGRTYGLIHGGAQLVCATDKPEQFVDRTLQRFEDVYRSCAHRAHDGAVGRVKFIGFDKSKSSNARTNQSSIKLKRAQILAARQQVLDAWPDFVTCDGVRQIHGGRVDILNWRMKRHPEYTP